MKNIKCPKCQSTDVLEPTENYPVYVCDKCGRDFVIAEKFRPNLNRVRNLWAKHGVFPSVGLIAKADCECVPCETAMHSSDCAVHNMPNLPFGECDCFSPIGV